MNCTYTLRFGRRCHEPVTHTVSMSRRLYGLCTEHAKPEYHPADRQDFIKPVSTERKGQERWTIRTQKHMTITEAHPFHGDVLEDTRDKGLQGPHREVQRATAPREVYVKHDERCPLCREEQEGVEMFERSVSKPVRGRWRRRCPLRS